MNAVRLIDILRSITFVAMRAYSRHWKSSRAHTKSTIHPWACRLIGAAVTCVLATGCASIRGTSVSVDTLKSAPVTPLAELMGEVPVDEHSADNTAPVNSVEKIVSAKTSARSNSKAETRKAAKVTDPAPVTPSTGVGKVVQQGGEKRARNHWIDVNMIRVDAVYYELEKKLQVERSTWSAGAAIANLMFNTASTLTPSRGVKANYLAATALTSGTLAIVDKESFFEQTVASLVAAMRANRKKVLVTIKEGMVRDIEVYSFADAHRDVQEYLRAGTLTEGMAFVAAAAKEESKEAIEKADDRLEEIADISEEDRDMSDCIRRSLATLDTAKTESLRTAYLKVDPNAPAGDLAALRTGVKEATAGASAKTIRKFYDAFNEAGLLTCKDGGYE